MKKWVGLQEPIILVLLSGDKMAKVILNDTVFNQFARRSELNDLHLYLKSVDTQRRLDPDKKIDASKFVEPDLFEKMDGFVKDLGAFIPPSVCSLHSFELRCRSNGFYVLTLIYPTSKLTMAKTLFNTLASNKFRLNDLRGRKVVYRRETTFHYDFDIEALSRDMPNGGVYNLSLLVYTLLHFNK